MAPRTPDVFPPGIDPERLALIPPSGPACTYGALTSATAEALDAARSAGVAPGDPVLLRGGYTPRALAAWLALNALGATLVPVTPELSTERLEQYRAIAAARWTLDTTAAEPVFARHAARTLPPQLQQLADEGRAGLILFSSGTTGEPKGIVHRLSALLPAPRAEARRRPLRLLALLHFDHIGGLNTLLQSLAAGDTLVVPPSHDPDAVAASLGHHQVQVLPASPTFLNLLLLSGAVERHDLRALRLITYGTEPMPESLLARLKEQFPKTRFLQTFGTSETGIHGTHSADATWMRFDDPRLETRIVEGELHLRGPAQALGYLNAPNDAFDADGWYHTGDLVEVRPDQSLRIVGRRTEVINVGGEKLLPAEVESVLLALPEVAGARVLAAPHPITGQTVVAELVRAAEAPAPDQLRRRLRQHCRRHLPPYKIPSRFVFRASLPVSARLKTPRA